MGSSSTSRRSAAVRRRRWPPSPSTSRTPTVISLCCASRARGWFARDRIRPNWSFPVSPGWAPTIERWLSTRRTDSSGSGLGAMLTTIACLANSRMELTALRAAAHTGVRLRGRDQREVDPIRKRHGNKFERPGVAMMGLRLAFSIPLLLSGLFSPVAAEAQQAVKVARIGYLSGNLAEGRHLLEAFRQGLRDLGYVEGR